MRTAYKNILVAVPPPAHEWYALSSDALRKVASTLSLVPDVHLTFMSVYSAMETVGDGEVNLLPPEVLRELNETREKQLKEGVSAYVKWFTDNGVSCEVVIEEGDDPADTVVAAAKRLKADLLLVGYHHDEGLFDLFLPDVAKRVAKHAPCDVLLIAPPRK